MGDSATKGLRATGDANTQRCDKITENVKNKCQVIDEGPLNSENVREAITQNAEYLKLVARNMITLNPNKFKFCPRDSVLD